MKAPAVEQMERPDERLRNQRFTQWGDIPPSLATRTALRTYGLRPPNGAVPFASMYNRNKGPDYDLYAFSDCIPVSQRERSEAQKAATLRMRAVTEAEQQRWRDYESDRRIWKARREWEERTGRRFFEDDGQE